MILGRIENGLIIPLSLCCEREKLLLGSAERDKLVSTFKCLHIHAAHLRLCVTAYHIHGSATQDSAMQSTIKLLLTHSL